MRRAKSQPAPVDDVGASSAPGEVDSAPVVDRVAWLKTVPPMVKAIVAAVTLLGLVAGGAFASGFTKGKDEKVVATKAQVDKLAAALIAVSERLAGLEGATKALTDVIRTMPR